MYVNVFGQDVLSCGKIWAGPSCCVFIYQESAESNLLIHVIKSNVAFTSEMCLSRKNYFFDIFKFFIFDIFYIFFLKNYKILSFLTIFVK